MDENENLDLEFKRYLQLLRPYLCQLLDQDVIQICDAWIKRLTDCTAKEKGLRNKYLFMLCYQLARGFLEGPFLGNPPEELPPLIEDFASDDSTTGQDLFTDSEQLNTQVLFNGKDIVVSETEYLYEGKNCESVIDGKESEKIDKHKNSRLNIVTCYPNPDSIKNYFSFNQIGEQYQHRANNLVKKLREIKMQNMLLQKELNALKEESKDKSDEYFEDFVVRVDNSTSANLRSNDSSATLFKSLRCRLKDVTDSRNILIDKINFLKDQLDNFHELKHNEIEDIKANHRLETAKIRSDLREEMKHFYEKKLEEQRLSYENSIRETENKASKEIRELKLAKDEIAKEKFKIVNAKDIEISQLKCQLEEQKSSLHSVLNKFIEKSNEDVSSDKFKTHLEKRLNKMEKFKTKYAKHYEAKLEELQRDKHLTECSLQLQLVKQRAQIVSELTDENQSELNASLEKLENKYKEIVANVQATAIQRRMQDQIALESILQAACGNECQGQFSRKNVRNQNQSYDSVLSSLVRGNKGGKDFVANKSIEEDSLVTGYCLKGERLGELFERVYIPQRDSGNPN